MAALEPKPPAEGDPGVVSVMIHHEKAEYMLCTLERGKLWQQPLDLNFTEGEEITISLNGNGTVHLTGYLMPEDEYPDDTMADFSEEDMDGEEESSEEEDDDEEEEEDSDEAPELVTPSSKRKRKAKMEAMKKKLKVMDGDDGYDESEDDDYLLGEAEDAGEEYSSGDSEDSDEEDDDDDDDDDDDELDEDDSDLDDLDESDEDDDDEDDSDDFDSDEEDSEDEESPMDMSGSFIEGPKEKKDAKSPALNGKTPEKSPKKKKKGEETPKKEKEEKSPKKTPKSEKKAKSPKSEKKQAKAEADEPEAGKSPKSEKKAKTPKSEKKAKVKAEDSESSEEVKTPKSEKKKDAKEWPKKEVAEEAKTPKSAKKKKNKDKGETPAKEESKGKTPKKQVLGGGLIAEEVKEGHGPEAKPGKMIHMYYRGTLQNGKEFDKCQQGKPFKFRLGKGEVIKGWDTGVAGMKVGGKRKLTVPPSQGYGSQRQGPIPANSTLVFELELRAVS